LKKSILSISLQKSEVVLESCNNIARNKTISFKIPVTLWVYGKKVQTKALVDLGTTTNFVDRVVVENNNLVTYKLANPYCVINVDSTPNKTGQITKYVQAYIEIGLYKTTQHLFVTNLGNKEMMIGYSYLYKHNPNIDWQKGQWEFTKCLDTYTSKARKIQDVEAEANELHLELDISESSLLDNIEDEDPSNYILSWADTTDPSSHQQTMIITAILNNRDQYRDLDYKDTKTWKAHVPEWLHKYRNMFSKNKSKRMPIWKLYN